jgi:hypothetical protein
MNPPCTVTHGLDTKVVVSGFLIVTAVQVNPPIELAMFRLMRCAATAVNVTLPFCPGVAIVIVAEDPPATIVPVLSAGTSYSVSVIAPVTLPGGFIAMVYVPVVGMVSGSTKPPCTVTQEFVKSEFRPAS